jgi:hypothetical protein
MNAGESPKALPRRSTCDAKLPSWLTKLSGKYPKTSTDGRYCCPSRLQQVEELHRFWIRISLRELAPEPCLIDRLSKDDPDFSLGTWLLNERPYFTPACVTIANTLSNSIRLSDAPTFPRIIPSVLVQRPSRTEWLQNMEVLDCLRGDILEG